MRKILITLILIFPLLLFCQEKQPKVGLVLSGGGAKGFAHVGVLKAIDEAGIQIYYIGGTSMGGIIGALYAAGYSGIQIEKIVTETDFVSILRDQLPRSTSPFFEKEYGENTAITLPVKKGKIGLPKAVSKGQNVLNLLLELFAPVEEVTDFSKLQTPFFCIATDVETGGEVLLEKGSLPIALRASASFPTLLNPVALNDKLLIDGGVANNFPIDVMRSKNVDIIIGVDVQGRLFEKEKLTSVIAILNQIISYQMYSKSNEQKEKLDVYIHPEIYDYNVVDFDKKSGILKKGDEAGKKYSAIFKEIAAKQKVKKKRKKIRLDTKKYKVSTIAVFGAENYTRAYVLGKLNIKENDSISRNEITKKIHLLSATKNYEQIKYKLKQQQDNSYNLAFTLKESNENASFKLGLHYDFLYKSAILANYTQKHLLRNNDLFSLDLILGDNPRYKLNYFVDNGFYISYGFRSSYSYFTGNTKLNNIFSNTSSNVNSVNLKYNDFTNQFFLQTTFDRKFALGLGVEHKNVRATTETVTTNNQETVFDKSNYISAFGYLKLDTYDDENFPTKGYFADLNAKWYVYSSDFNNNFQRFLQAKGTIGFATKISENFTFQNTNEAGFSLDNPASNVFDFYLGSYNKNYVNTFISFYGYDFAEIADKTFLKSEFNFRYEFSKNHYATFIANYARLETNVFENIDLFKDIKSGYALGYSYNTFIGPIEVKYSWSPDKNQNYWLFNVGFWF